MNVDPTIRRRLAPTGRLHVAISLCNGMLAQRREGERTPTGVAVDLAHAIAERLDIPMTLVVTPTVRQAVACAERGLADNAERRPEFCLVVLQQGRPHPAQGGHDIARQPPVEHVLFQDLPLCGR